ncbi:MAG: RecX family transcriptional regulator [Muribaculaceae bacterium]|nr:RecX family transcriptional regulator [Muribaculaceae bacterium]
MAPLRQKTVTPQQALVRLETLCAASEQCSHELLVKLTRWGISASDSKSILESLTRRKFLSDKRFAVAYVRDKYRFGKWGRRKIALGLAQKRIDRNTITEALDSIDDEEYNNILRAIMRSRARTIKEGNSYEGRNKLYRAMLSRGYESSLIASIIKDSDLWSSL